MSDTNPPPAADKPAAKPKADAEPKRFAIYDLKFLRFVSGPSYDDKSKAAAELKGNAKLAGRKADEFELREV